MKDDIIFKVRNVSEYGKKLIAICRVWGVIPQTAIRMMIDQTYVDYVQRGYIKNDREI